MSLSHSLTLPCGAILPNRIAKASMTEGLADRQDQPTLGHQTLYRRWSQGGAGLLLTGNVMVDGRFLERPGNVVVHEGTDRDALRAWADAGTIGGNHLWMQINHPGRQCQRLTASQPLAPSAVQLKLGGLFGTPRAMTEAEILDAIARWATVARIAKQTGFTGVQVHAAHGYLCSQFLSPHTNRRTDDWGGSLENRARFLLAVVDAVREAVGANFPVSVKLNSADFRKGGFSDTDAMQVAAWLEEAGVDLLEISGGTYESTAFLTGTERSEATADREAYFLAFAHELRKTVRAMPLMVTGGFRTRSVMARALDAGDLDVVGIARPFCVHPDLARGLVDGTLEHLPTPERALALGGGGLGPGSRRQFVRAINSQAATAWFYRQILRLAAGKEPEEAGGAWPALLGHVARDTVKGLVRR